MRLSKQTLSEIPRTSGVKLPDPKVFGFPEKILQFGTGVFIRGLIDYFIDKANNEGKFGGRVVMVKSTDAGDLKDFTKQEGLYTLLMKSVEEGQELEEKVICASVSRVLSAVDQWQEVLKCAANPEMKIIFSNTTEIGIVLVEEDKTDARPPASFPGKLLAFLHERYKVFDGSADSGMVIVPTELIPGNGTKLKSIVHQLAVLNKMDEPFIHWLDTANDFCNSLVDRIVPGRLPDAEHKQTEKLLGYTDELMIMSETFGLWAIETSSPRTRGLLSFSDAHPGIHLVEDIEKFRELKLRLLNGSHNLSCALGYIAGFQTVKEAMANPHFDRYMRRLILDEIASSILSDKITMEDAHQFGSKVLDRYRNPHINFEWLSICVQDTSKIRIRAVPIAVQHHQKYGRVPDCISLGFAAYMLFMKSEKSTDGQYTGHANGRTYTIQDDFAENLFQKWKSASGLQLVEAVLADRQLWDTDLSKLNGFADSVNFYLDNLSQNGFVHTVELAYRTKETAVQINP
ncbi:MAG: tagaturonate reductase [Chitinophagaceae bacterium]|nr:tagaturonate reductase [Chitinophagaceae bacterium]